MIKPITNNQVAIIDYDIGNLFSVQRACEHVGLVPVVTSNKNVIGQSEAVILPGVGAFGDAMKSLKKLDLISLLKEFIQSGKPFMGICLGMQLLLSESMEFGQHRGLDIINGSVIKFDVSQVNSRRIKVPQVGWNKVLLPPNASEDLWSRSILSKIENGEYMYFVHSYYAVPTDPNVTVTVTKYEEITYCSGILHRNVLGFQFHPEKSGPKGITIYRNFKEMVSKGGIE